MKYFKIIFPVLVTLYVFWPVSKKKPTINPFEAIVEQINFFDKVKVTSLLSEETTAKDADNYTLPDNLPPLLDTEEQDSCKEETVKAVPLATVKSVPLNSNYKVNVNSMITSSVIDSKLGGAIKNKGNVIISHARKYNICPIFLTAIIMHESGNGTSRFANGSMV